MYGRGWHVGGWNVSSQWQASKLLINLGALQQSLLPQFNTHSARKISSPCGARWFITVLMTSGMKDCFDLSQRTAGRLKIVANGLENTCYKALTEVPKWSPVWVGASRHKDIWISNWRRVNEFWVKILGFFDCISDLHTIKRRKGKWIGHSLRRNCFLKRLYWNRDRREEKMRKKTEAATGWPQRDKKIPEFQRECTRSQSVENSLRERLRTCRKADCRVNEWILLQEQDAAGHCGLINPLIFDEQCKLQIQKYIYEIYLIIILPVVLCGYDYGPLTFREDHNLKVFDNSVLRKMFGTTMDEVTGDCRRLHSE